MYLCLCTENFHEVLSSTTVHHQVNFNFESTFVKQYFGTDHSHQLSYEEFVQLLQVMWVLCVFMHVCSVPSGGTEYHPDDYMITTGCNSSFCKEHSFTACM